MFRLGRNGNIFHWGYNGSCEPGEREENQLVMGITTSTSYIYILLVLMVSIALGEGDSGKFMVSST